VAQPDAHAWQDDDALAGTEGYAAADGAAQHDDEALYDQFAPGAGIQIAVVRPRIFRDAATIGDYYRQDIPVIISLEDMANADATRIIDFVSGLVLGRCGDIERLSRRAFLIVPAGAAILTAHDGLAEEGFFNQALRPTAHESILLATLQTALTAKDPDEIFK
jgi:cell division inhibitor SepF